MCVFILIISGDPPVLERVTSNGLCDIRKQDCLRARVIGRNYVESDKLACGTKKLKVSFLYESYTYVGGTIVDMLIQAICAEWKRKHLFYSRIFHLMIHYTPASQ